MGDYTKSEKNTSRQLIDTVFHYPIFIDVNDGNCENAIKQIKKYSKNNKLSWSVRAEISQLEFTFIKRSRISAKEAGEQLLNIAHILKENDIFGKSITSFRTCKSSGTSWGDMEAGSIFFEVDIDHACMKMIALDDQGKPLTFQKERTF